MSAKIRNPIDTVTAKVIPHPAAGSFRHPQASPNREKVLPKLSVSHFYFVNI